jgi:hypothetical protein
VTVPEAARTAYLLTTGNVDITDDRVSARRAAASAIDGFDPFWLGITAPTDHPGFGAGEQGDASVYVGAGVHLLRTRRTCTSSLQITHKLTLERIFPVM